MKIIALQLLWYYQIRDAIRNDRRMDQFYFKNIEKSSTQSKNFQIIEVIKDTLSKWFFWCNHKC